MRRVACRQITVASRINPGKHGASLMKSDDPDAAPRALSDINLEEGFYPRLTESFREHYGKESVFVRAVADTFTLALSRMLEAKGKLAEGTVVPVLGIEAAYQAVGRLLRAVPLTHNILLQESFGALPVGSYSAAVDKIMGAGFFDRWHSYLESRNYKGANEMLPKEPEAGKV
jgi:hypothetical protein